MCTIQDVVKDYSYSHGLPNQFLCEGVITEIFFFKDLPRLALTLPLNF